MAALRHGLPDVSTQACSKMRRTRTSITVEGEDVFVLGGGDTARDCVGTSMHPGLQEPHTAGNHACAADGPGIR